MYSATYICLMLYHRSCVVESHLCLCTYVCRRLSTYICMYVCTPTMCSSLVIECPDPGIPENGRRQLSTITVGSQVVYDCDDGFTLSGERAQECLVNGTWSSQLPSCERESTGICCIMSHSQCRVGSGEGQEFECQVSVSFLLLPLSFKL